MGLIEMGAQGQALRWKSTAPVMVVSSRRRYRPAKAFTGPLRLHRRSHREIPWGALPYDGRFPAASEPVRPHARG